MAEQSFDGKLGHGSNNDNDMIILLLGHNYVLCASIHYITS